MSLLPTTVSTRESRALPLRTGEPLDVFQAHRRCVSAGCGAILSRYNPAERCGVHCGWRDAAQPKRRRR